MTRRKAYKALYERIDFAMTDQKVSADALGRAAGHSDGSYIRRMRKGEKRAQSATQQTAETVSRMLGLPLDYLFTEVDRSTGRPVVGVALSKTVVSEHQRMSA